jgi:hypothetical protein
MKKEGGERERRRQPVAASAQLRRSLSPQAHTGRFAPR